MKGVISHVHRLWLVRRVTESSPTAVELQKARDSLRGMCDRAVIAHIAACVGITHEQATRIAGSNLFACFGGDVKFEMPGGLPLGRLDTSFRCLSYDAVVKIGPDVAQEFSELHSQCAKLDFEVDAIKAEAGNYFSTVCCTYTKLKNTHSALYRFVYARHKRRVR